MTYLELDRDSRLLVRRLQLQTRFLAAQGLTGAYRSAFRGQGLEFEEVREYREGDDLRSIDWKVTARARVPYVKAFREERQLSVMIVLDHSASMSTGTHPQLKKSTAAEVAALVALLAEHNRDRLGLATFSDQLDHFLLPRHASRLVPQIFQRLFATQQTETKRLPSPDDGISPLERTGRALYPLLPKGTVLFLVSDFHDSRGTPVWARIGREFDVNAVLVRDPIDLSLGGSGLMRLKDAETSLERIVHLGDKTTQDQFVRRSKELQENQEKLFGSMNACVLELDGWASPVKRLERFLLARQKKKKSRITEWLNR